MSDFAEKYAIAFGHEQIGLLKCDADHPWVVVESIKVVGLTDEQIDAEFAKVAKPWARKSKHLAACLPADVVVKISSASELGEHVIIQYPSSEFSIVKHAPFDHYIFDHEHVELTTKFLAKYKIHPKELGVYAFAKPEVAPIFFDINDCKKQIPSTQKPSAPQMAFDFESKDTARHEHGQNISKSAPKSPSQQKPYRLIISLAFAIMLAGLGYYFWAPNVSKPPITPLVESADLEIQPETRNDTAPLTRPEPEPVTPLAAADFPTLVRPLDHEDIVNRFTMDQASMILESPNFTALERPSDQEAYIEKFIKDGPGLDTTADAGSEVSDQTEQSPDEAQGSGPKLIGISGASGSPGALIQDQKGKFHRAKVGDVIDGWKIEAISKKEVIIRKAKDKETLTVPAG